MSVPLLCLMYGLVWCWTQPMHGRVQLYFCSCNPCHAVDLSLAVLAFAGCGPHHLRYAPLHRKGLSACHPYLQGKTSPPDYLSESELIGLMERHGIGTDASIAVHINNICERNYVKIESGRRVVPTELGITLICGYQRIDPELCRPQVRAVLDVLETFHVCYAPPPSIKS